MGKKPSGSGAAQPVALTSTVSTAQTKLLTRVNLGRSLEETAIRSEAELIRAKAEYGKWNDYNRELLLTLFTTPAISEEYSSWVGVAVFGERAFDDKVSEFRDDVTEKIHRLESIVERLELWAPEAVGTAIASPSAPEYARRVFVVHGHDDHLKLDVARLLEQLDFEAIILHEMPSRGRTIIEKFESYANVGFAVALLTPDDLGSRKPEPGKSPDLVARARQNVIFELGFFLGKLGRERVVALHKGDTEILTDFSGVVYTRVDGAGHWRLELAHELKAAGYVVNFEKIK